MNCAVLVVFHFLVCIFNYLEGASIGNRQIGDNEFLIPKMLKLKDNLTITGQFKTDKSSMTVRLVKAAEDGSPDDRNVPCQATMYFPNSESTRDTVTMTSIVNGNPTVERDEQSEPSLLFSDNHFQVSFTVHQDKKIAMYLKGSPTRFDFEWSENIKFITVEGDVEKIDEISFIPG